MPTRPTRQEKVAAFRALHQAGCFIMPNPWDAGGAKLLTMLGAKALATTSSGFAHSIGSRDGADDITRDMTLAHAASIAATTHLPVNADTEDCYGKTARDIAETVRLAAEAGLAGLSIEDRWPGGPQPYRTRADAIERVGAAVEAARQHNIVLTARADGHLMGWYDLEETITRLQAFEKLGADVVYAPGLKTIADLMRICTSVKTPVNHLAAPGVKGAGLADIAKAGARRISTGGALAKAVGGAMKQMSEAILAGDFGVLEDAPGWREIGGG
jgi:2-methylisocitrate lyase-like PEP mutase family enzyme